ncbi:MAG: M81 family metallopeptidase [Phycisphaeraceae bacterium]
MRVGIIALQHESNTFVPTPTTLADFEANTLALGQAVRDAAAGAHHEVAGFLAGLEEANVEAVPIMFARATPSGTITAETVDQLLDLIHQQLDGAGTLDGLLVAPHGAAVSERERDLDGYWLNIVRERVGPEMPIACTLDPHANVSQRMIDACNATITYRTNPHTDQRDVGLKAARLLTRMLRGEVTLTQAVAHPQVAISIDKQETAAQPCADLYALANEIQQRDKVLSDSVILGFPYADVAELGSGFIVVTDNDRALAQRYADELSQWLYEHRQRYACDLPEVDEAVREVAQSKERICLLDVGDNIGGGGPADGTTLAHALDKHGVADSIICLYDAEAAQQARDAGVGAKLTLTMGGKTDNRHGEPFTAEVTVRRLHDGKFRETEPRHGGRTAWDQGPTAIVQTARGLTILLNSRRTSPFSLHQINSTGLDAAQFRVFVAKGVNAPIAAYQEVADRFIRVNTPGLTGANMTRFTYQHRPKPLYPFEEPAP